MNSIPKVSVIIPVYNTERYLQECLDSVVNQTLRDIEIICVDDGSTDGSSDILRDYQSKDERITILKQEKTNAGAARNLGLSIATGDYLSFLDSDDFFELTMLEQMYACAKNRNADIVVCEMKVFHEDSNAIVPVNWHIRKELLPSNTVFSFCDIKSNAFRCIVSYVWDKLIKRDIVIKNQLQFQSQQVYNDVVFAYSAMISAERITVLDKYLVYNRIRTAKDSITDFRYYHIDCVHSVLSGLREFLARKGIYEQYKRDYICYAVHLMHHTYIGNKNDTAIKKEMQKKIALWLEEFDITGHTPIYYFELMTYQDLLQKIDSKATVAECAWLQPELDRLQKSPLCRVARFRNRLLGTIKAVSRCVNEKGIRYTIHRIGEKLINRSNQMRDVL